MFDDSQHIYLVSRLRRTRRALMGNQWVETTEPLNPDGPEAAMVLEAIIKDVRVLLDQNKSLEEDLRETRENLAAVNKSLKEAQDALKPPGKPLLVKNYEKLFNTRVLNCFQNIKLKDLRQLEKLTAADLANVPNLGIKSQSEIKRFMRVHGLKFARETVISPDIVREGRAKAFRRFA